MVFLNGFKVKALFDSSESFIHPSLVETASLFVHPSSGIGQYPWLLPTMSLKLLGTVWLILPIKTIHMKTFV
jgi:hypothetical protein